ncbi:prepilin-type N-terminal cleavage/methylation domain-containing protein [Bacillus alkalicellulosilyticus]|uniref:prepilin-type N-terminal cleavage/methylation domain-containing protein n=1 Tax=Alkalihalobacterium alkalicellulosilyticum TaxID=1912214 RepID=UPI0009977E08|nr:prepilin-type N-terminal cleavage/methylation domain-containing protein [Bacillus alkalicellulosilyticus]
MMSRLKGNNKGLTLIEVVATLAIVSMVLLLINAIHLSGQKQVVTQSNQIEHQGNVRLALNMITKEIRSAEKVEVAGHVITLKDKNGVEVAKIKHAGTEILKNGDAMISFIDQLLVEKVDNKITLDITSEALENGQQVRQSTVIYIRK